MSEPTKWKQTERLMRITTELDSEPGEDRMLLYGLVGREGVSTLFNYHVRLLSTDHQIQPGDMIGTNATITITVDRESGRERHLNGFVHRFYTLGTLKEFRVYEAELVPWLWHLQLTSDCRIFQDQKVDDILKRVLSDHYVSDVSYDHLQGEYPKLEYCVQYRETAFDFVSRLMEEYGIFYLFRHRFGRHTLVLADSNLVFQDFDANPIAFSQEKMQETPRVLTWKHCHEHRFGRWKHTDFNYRKPRAEMLASRDTTLEIPKSNPWERFDYPGRYEDASEGDARARVRMEEEQAHHHTAEGAGTHAGFVAGGTFVLDKHDRPEDENTRYVVTALEFTALEPSYTEDSFWNKLISSLPQLLIDVGKGAGGAVADAFVDIFKGLAGGFGQGLKTLGSAVFGGVKDPLQKWAEDRGQALFESLEPGYNNHFFCIPAKTPLLAPQVTRKPRVAGPQTAIVMAPNDHEIWTDELGRVKVKFHWDRYAEAGLEGETSCWIRFSEGWAGRQWGTLHPPRRGQEVIVDFLEGDPDRPLITGRVYNSDNKPAFELRKYQSRSGLKTRSTPHSGKGGYHMLRFEDAAGEEQVLLRSQRRLDVRAYGSAYETVHANRHALIGYQDEDTRERGGSVFITVGDEWNLHTGGARYEGVDDVYHLRVSKDHLVSIEGGQSTSVGGVAQLNARAVRIEAATKISLKAGGSFVVIDPSGVSINGPIVRINSGGAADAAAGGTILDPIDASIADNGEPGYLEHLRELQAKGGGGGHRARAVPAQHGPSVTRNPDGTLQFSPGIRVDGSSPDYAAAVIADLSRIGTTREGQRLFQGLDSSGHTVTIAPGNPPPNPPNAFAMPGSGSPADFAAATPAGQPVYNGAGAPLSDAAGNPLVGTGQGSDSNVTYNPEQWPDPTSASQAPGDAILFHELTHADNMEHGRYDGTPRTDNFDTNEELNTIGPENRYRDERGVPRRTDHHDL